MSIFACACVSPITEGTTAYSGVPSPSPSTTPSGMPSGVPSTTPSGMPSGVPSTTPSTVPSPSTTPSSHGPEEKYNDRVSPAEIFNPVPGSCRIKEFIVILPHSQSNAILISKPNSLFIFSFI